MAGEVWALPVAVVQVDGDTLELNYNLGFNIRRTARARLLGVNTAEVFGIDPRTAKAVEGHKQAEWVSRVGGCWCCRLQGWLAF